MVNVTKVFEKRFREKIDDLWARWSNYGDGYKQAHITLIDFR